MKDNPVAGHQVPIPVCGSQHRHWDVKHPIESASDLSRRHVSRATPSPKQLDMWNLLRRDSKTQKVFDIGVG